jgi:hypothetical protein
MCRNIMEIAFSYTNRLRLGQAKGGLAFNKAGAQPDDRRSLPSSASLRPYGLLG